MAGIDAGVDRSAIGKPLADLDTPALCIDVDLFDANLKRMAEFFNGRAAKLRPHFKNNKCSQIALRQLEAGWTVGMTCAKLGEAEVLAAAGCGDILIANQIIGPAKIARLVEVARKTVTMRVAVDQFENAAAIAAAAVRAGVTIGLLVEVDIGMGRCGVAPGRAALDLARRIVDLKGVRFDGLQAYEGHLVAVADREERRRRVREDMAKAIETRRIIEGDGLKVAIISGGSTSTYDATGTIEGVNEVQAGTYPTMDHMYVKLSPEFAISLSILAPGDQSAEGGCGDSRRRAQRRRARVRRSQGQGHARRGHARAPVRGALHGRERAGLEGGADGRVDPQPLVHDVQSLPPDPRASRRPGRRRLADRGVGTAGVIR